LALLTYVMGRIVSLVCGVALAEALLPNFIFLLTDDQDILLNGTSAMPTLLQEVVGAGLTLSGFVDVPVCCPSRTSTLAARYSHNLNNTNLGWCGNFGAEHEGRTWIRVLRDAGYQTSLFGKYYNDYGNFCGANVHVGVCVVCVFAVVG
jgi:N-acetylglucosamine-6-sulfatase